MLQTPQFRSAEKQIQATDEIHERNEERLKNKLATVMAHHEGPVKELEREGKKTTASIRMQMESLALGKDNDLSRVKEIV